MKKLLSTSALCLGIVGAAAVDARAQNNLFVSNIGNNTVAGYNTTTGAMAGIFTGGGINQPVGLAASGGSLYVTSYDSGAAVSNILRLDNNGGITSAVQSNSPPFGNALSNPKAIAFGANPNTLYVANGGAGSPANNSYIGVANVNTGGYNQSITPGGSGFGGPGPLNGGYALAYDGSRYLYAGNLAPLNNNAIVRFDTSVPNDPGTQITLVPTANLLGTPQSNIAVLNGLAVGPDGALYATDGTRGTVLRIAAPDSVTATSNFTLVTTAFAGQGPEGLAFEPLTNLLYVSTDNDNIQRVILGGSALTGYTTGATDPSFLVQEPVGAGAAFLAFSPIPEPSTYALFGVASAALLVFGLKRRQQLTLRA